jgi:ParB family chromosome partitioning protein
MSEKRRGLGRGLGALIPPAPAPAQPDADRPVDVFFPDRKDGAEDDGQPQARSAARRPPHLPRFHPAR